MKPSGTIAISKPAGYLAGLLLTLLIYFIGQGIFFFNAQKTKASICDTYERRGVSSRYPGRMTVFYICFITKDGKEVKVRAGTNLSYNVEDSVDIYYKKNHPSIARVKSFKTLWLVPSLYYLIPFALIFAFITGIYAGTSYVMLSLRPFKIWLSSY